MRTERLLAAFAVASLLALSAPASAADWGTIKGKVVFAGDKIPARTEITIDTDAAVCAACIKGGKHYFENLLVDPTTKGVRNVVVALVNDPKSPLPIHPALKTPPKKLFIDQPCFAFEPHILCIQEGQVLELKNTATVPHNVNITGGGRNPNFNQLIPPGKTIDVEGWKASPYAVPFSCNIHKWMKGYARVHNHPYFAVTNDKGEFEIKNAPAGNYRISVWQEEVGWVTGDKTGVPITIKANGVTEVKYDLKPSK